MLPSAECRRWVLYQPSMNSNTTGAARLLSTMLFHLAPSDPATLSVAVALLGGAGLVACYLPAARAARLDPLIALRLD